MWLDQQARLEFAHLPTPIEPLTRLTKHLGGPSLWIKRDDCTGLGGGGNKTRKLEFLMADALANDATVIVTVGATQSNHARQTAAISAKLGLNCHLILENRIGDVGVDFTKNGNVLLDHLFGATVDNCRSGEAQDTLRRTLDNYKERGESAYFIPGGGSNPIGALGYAAAAQEILDQTETMDLRVDAVVHATASSGTQAGLLAGFSAANAHIPVLGISAMSPAEVQQQHVHRLASETGQLIGDVSAGLDDVIVGLDDVIVNSDYIGPGYGHPTNEMRAAVSLVARLEGILLDPVYTGKAMAGLVDLISNSRFDSDENILFVHTGGMPGLFGYRQTFEQVDRVT